MKVVTYNIRCDFGQDGENNFEFRKPLILRRIREEKPDIIAFQEVLPHVCEWLKESLSDYLVAGCGRDENLSEEHMLFALNKKTISLLGLETFWLSPAPQKPGSRFDIQSPCPRNCCRALIRISGAASPVYVYATHLDHESNIAREQGLGVIARRIKQDLSSAAYPVILLGDFNFEPEEWAGEQFFLQYGFRLNDVSRASGGTFHDYGRQIPAQKIDYIFASREFSNTPACCWKDEENGIFATDHYPVCVELTLETGR